MRAANVSLNVISLLTNTCSLVSRIGMDKDSMHISSEDNRIFGQWLLILNSRISVPGDVWQVLLACRALCLVVVTLAFFFVCFVVNACVTLVY